MNANELVSALQHLGIRTPYGLYPGSIPGGWNAPLTLAAWDAYQWNPPEYMASEYTDLDPNASDKPTWQEIVDAVEPAKLVQIPPQLIELANSEVTRRIAVNYHPQGGRDRNKEWEVRLSGQDMATKDTERVRLIAVCHAIEASINAATTTAQLDAIDITRDSVWSADDD